jgi:hypothetical protein
MSTPKLIYFMFCVFIIAACSKTKLVYYTPQMAKPVDKGEVIAVTNPTNEKEQAVFILKNKHHPNYTSGANATSKVLSKTTSVKIFKHEVVNHLAEKIVKTHPKLAKVSYNRFGRLYLGLGMIALAALLILILVNIPSLSGDDGCVIFAMLLMLAGVGFLTAISGLIYGLLN